MGAPQVITAEVDLSTRVPGFEGVYIAAVGALKMGPTDGPTLVTTESEFLKKYTPQEKVLVGYDDAYWSTLIDH